MPQKFLEFSKHDKNYCCNPHGKLETVGPFRFQTCSLKHSKIVGVTLVSWLPLLASHPALFTIRSNSNIICWLQNRRILHLCASWYRLSSCARNESLLPIGGNCHIIAIVCHRGRPAQTGNPGQIFRYWRGKQILVRIMLFPQKKAHRGRGFL